MHECLLLLALEFVHACYLYSCISINSIQFKINWFCGCKKYFIDYISCQLVYKHFLDMWSLLLSACISYYRKVMEGCCIGPN